MADDELRCRAEEIGDSALELDADTERETYIERACQGDQVLRAMVLEYVQGGDSVSLEPVIAESPSVSFKDRQIGPWKLMRLLGEGGFGVVYLAERNDGQVRQLGAIKFLKGTVRNWSVELRFLDERQILANLNHPGIARLIDAGLSSEEQPYLVMEFIEKALPIDSYCRDHRLPVKDILLLFRRVCEAVSYAHRKLVVHRGLKPANILVTADGAPHLLDFGIARILDPTHRAGDEAPPSIGILLGTERYFSPEQARREPLDTATDIYSLGVILYELLVGADPYNFASRIKESVQQIVCIIDPELPSRAVVRRSSEEQVCSAPVSGDKTGGRASSRLGSFSTDLEQRRKELSGDLDAILLQALCKEREKRYASVADFSDDIHRHLEHLPVQARLNTFGYRMSSFVRRNRERVAAAAVAVVLLLAGLASTIYQRQQAVSERQIAIARELAAYANQSSRPIRNAA
jgi:serine/threonine protein kinase